MRTSRWKLRTRVDKHREQLETALLVLQEIKPDTLRRAAEVLQEQLDLEVMGDVPELIHNLERYADLITELLYPIQITGPAAEATGKGRR